MTQLQAIEQALKENAEDTYGEDFDELTDFLSYKKGNNDDIEALIYRAMTIYTESKMKENKFV